MDYTCDHKWPVKSRGLYPSWAGAQDMIKSDAIQTRSGSEMVAITICCLCQVASGPLIILYDPSHAAGRWIPQSFRILERHFVLPDLIRDPSPAAFMVACLAYAVAAAAFSSLHPNDQYRQRFLLFAVCVATVLSFATTHNMRSWLPPTITTALVLSVFTHYIFPSLRAEAIEEVDRVEPRDDEAL